MNNRDILVFNDSSCVNSGSFQPLICGFLQDAHAWHLSYHDGEHYNSVRLANDYGDEAAMPISISPNGTVTPESVSTSGSRWGQQKMAAVRWGTGCEDETKLTEALDKAKGDPAKVF